MAALAFRTRHRADRKDEMRAIRFRAAFAIGAALCFFVAMPLSAQAAAGDLDPTFGTGGKVTTPIGLSTGYASALAVQGDGKIVAAGFCFTPTGNNVFCLARYNTDGSLDPGFGPGGTVMTAVTVYPGDRAQAVALQSDGKIVAAGPCSGGAVFCLVRYNNDGSLDTSFGSGGEVTTVIGAFAFVRTMAVQGDGKLVVAGQCTIGAIHEFCLARYNSDGNLDTTFGVLGIVATAIGTGVPGIFRVVVQGDGKLVVAGQCTIGAIDEFCLARYNSDGNLDTTFGVGGIVATTIGTTNVVPTVAIRADGSIVAAGTCLIGSTREFCLARYNSSGSLDTTFGASGTTTTAVGASGDSVMTAMALQGDGKIVAVGTCFIGPAVFCLARYNSDGSLDLGFGTGGTLAATAIVGVGGDYAFAGVALQSDGKIVVGGACFPSDTHGYFFCLARFDGGASVVQALEPAGGTLSTGSVVSASDPLATAVTTPNAGLVTIAESATTLPPPTGYSFFGQQVDISAPAATPTTPLVITFLVDQTLVNGAGPSAITVFRDGSPVADCSASAGTSATPDPCELQPPTVNADNSILITIRTSQASHWNLGRPMYAFSGFLTPVEPAPTPNRAKAGSGVPVKFSLGGNRGFAIFVKGYPASRAVDCDSGAPTGLETIASAGNSNLTYDATNDQYTYVWKTQPAWAGTCRQLVVALKDGSMNIALFKFTKS
ncbi:MAG: PxKF domain-containing protein [Gaiellaceae bacterium]